MTLPTPAVVLAARYNKSLEFNPITVSKWHTAVDSETVQDAINSLWIFEKANDVVFVGLDTNLLACMQEEIERAENGATSLGNFVFQVRQLLCLD